jgi:CheY-like chemotaxis protein
VLISDVEMPGEDGYTLIRRLRALSPDAGGKTPAVALTAFNRSEDRIRSFREGFSIHLSKPVDPDELILVIANLAGRVDQGSTEAT